MSCSRAGRPGRGGAGRGEAGRGGAGRGGAGRGGAGRGGAGRGGAGRGGAGRGGAGPLWALIPAVAPAASGGPRTGGRALAARWARAGGRWAAGGRAGAPRPPPSPPAAPVSVPFRSLGDTAPPEAHDPIPRRENVTKTRRLAGGRAGRGSAGGPPPAPSPPAAPVSVPFRRLGDTVTAQSPRSNTETQKCHRDARVAGGRRAGGPGGPRAAGAGNGARPPVLRRRPLSVPFRSLGDTARPEAHDAIPRRENVTETRRLRAGRRAGTRTPASGACTTVIREPRQQAAVSSASIRGHPRSSAVIRAHPGHPVGVEP